MNTKSKPSAVPASFAEVIALWGRITECALDVGEPYETVRQWKTRNSIPARAHRRIVQAGRARGFPLTHELMADLAAQRSQESA